MKPSPVDRTFDPLSNGMHNSLLTKCHLEHYSTEATYCQMDSGKYVFVMPFLLTLLLIESKFAVNCHHFILVNMRKRINSYLEKNTVFARNV